MSKVETEFGFLSGRDCIYLDDVIYLDRTNALCLGGDLNSSLCSKAPESMWIKYELIFSSVIASKVVALEHWYKASGVNTLSSFDEIEESSWKRELLCDSDQKYKHYIIQTYDDVVEVVCESFTLKCAEPRS